MPARSLRAAQDAVESGSLRRSGTRSVPILLQQIRVHQRLRNLDPGSVEGLMESISRRGLQQAVVVRPHAMPDRDNPTRWGPETPGLFILVAGAHRLEACRRLGMAHIDAFVRNMPPRETRLLEIDENLIRAELTALDRAHFLAERQALYQALFPQSRHGGARRNGRETWRPGSFAADASEQTGMSVRAVQRAVRIHRNLAPELRERISGTELAGKEGELHRLAGLPADRQQCEVDRLLSRGGPEDSRTPPPGRRSRRDGAHRLEQAWEAASPDERRRFMKRVRLQLKVEASN